MREPELTVDQPRRGFAGGSADLIVCGDDAVLALYGEIDVADGQPLREALATACAAARHVYVDLAAVDFIDWSSLRTIIDAADGQRQRGAMLRIVDAGPRVARLIRLTNSAGLVGSG